MSLCAEDIYKIIRKREFMNMNKSNEIIIFENQEVTLEVNMKDETVWLSLEQMAELFGRDKSVISRHIKNAREEECDDSTVAKFATVQKEGKREVTRDIEYYNLDMIISVGYRVKSKNGILFRKWANQILKDYMLKGCAVNQKRLESLEKTVQLIDIASRIPSKEDAKEVLDVIHQYSKAFQLLDGYDHKAIMKPQGRILTEIITYDECISIIRELRFQADSSLFALERNKGLESILRNIYQSYDGKDIYPSIEEKAANFLYLTVKNHVFIDGNKRIAATLFIYFLSFYNILYKGDELMIQDATLVALTLMIAESNPKEKDILVDLIMNLLSPVTEYDGKSVMMA